MHLAFLEISNYRGIEHLELTLGPLTTLIGENSYGKSNLLDALLVCLGVGSDHGSFPILADDFREDGHGGHLPLEIRVGFRETSDGEWKKPPFEGLDAHVWLGPDHDRRLELRVRATRSGDPPAVAVEARFVDGQNRVVGPPPSADLIACVRQHVPVLLLKADRYFTRPSRTAAEHRPVEIEQRVAQELNELLGQLGDLHRPNVEAEVERGVNAAIAYVERFGGERLKRRMGPLLATGPQGIGTSSAARAIALLLVLGPLIEFRCEGTFGPHCRPIVAIEDAEAYLHPVVLAAVAGIIRAIPGQRIVTTNSADLIAMLPLQSLRRLVRHTGGTRTYRLGRRTLDDDELRRISYHVRANRGTALFARAWLLVEGETEFWLLPELAAHLGIDFALEGIRCMEYAQCGVAPLVKLANQLGIEWHLLADGDRAGEGYASAAVSFLGNRSPEERVTRLPDRDIEHTLWHFGYADVYRTAIPSAAPRRFDRRPKVENPTPTIERAVRARSKPGMALAAIDAIKAAESPGVPPPLRRAIETTALLARASFDGS